jgi:hypothetical protein
VAGLAALRKFIFQRSARRPRPPSTPTVHVNQQQYPSTQPLAKVRSIMNKSGECATMSRIHARMLLTERASGMLCFCSPAATPCIVSCQHTFQDVSNHSAVFKQSSNVKRGDMVCASAVVTPNDAIVPTPLEKEPHLRNATRKMRSVQRSQTTESMLGRGHCRRHCRQLQSRLIC